MTTVVAFDGETGAVRWTYNETQNSSPGIFALYPNKGSTSAGTLIFSPSGLQDGTIYLFDVGVGPSSLRKVKAPYLNFYANPLCNLVDANVNLFTYVGDTIFAFPLADYL